MKWLGYLVGIAVAGVAAAFILAWLLIDAGQVTKTAADQLARRIGRPVELGEINLSLLPSPAVRVRNVRVGDTDRGERPLLQAEEVRFNVSLLALFAGKTVFRSLSIVGPQLELERGPDGMPRIPPARGDALPSADTDGGEAPTLLITSLRVTEGRARVGDLELTDIEVSGGGNLDLSADFDLTATLPGIGKLRDGNIELTNLIEGPVRWKAGFTIAEVDLGEAREVIAPGSALYGEAEARIELEGEAERMRDASLALALRPLDFRTDTLRVNGDVDLRASLGKTYELDLTQATLGVSDQLSKPSGGVAKLSGPAPALTGGGDPAAALREWRDWKLELGSSRLRGDASLERGQVALDFSGELDFTTLSKWSPNPSFPQAGRLVLDRVRYAPLRPLQGEGRAEDLEIALSDTWKVDIGGPVYVEGTRIGSEDLRIRWLNENFGVRGSYDLAARNLDAELTATGAELKNLSESLDGEPRISGRLYGRVSLNGVPTLEGLNGNGEFEIPGGEMFDVSMGDFLRSKGESLREGVDTFRSLSGAFELSGGVLQLSRILFEQDAAAATLSGLISLRDRMVDLRGEARYYAGADVIASQMRITGPLNRFRTELATVEDEAERRRTEGTMLRSMRDLIRERGIPEDPEMAQAYREQLDRLDRLIENLDALERSQPLDVSARPPEPEPEAQIEGELEEQDTQL